MTIGDFKKMYFPTGSSEEKKEVLFKMADVYRSMIEHECRVIDSRTTWFLTLNGFLFAAFGIILAYYKDYHSFLIFISLAFAFIACLLAILVYKRGMDSAGRSIYCIHKRWLGFLENYIGYRLSPTELNDDYHVPPIWGRISKEFAASLQNDKGSDKENNSKYYWLIEKCGKLFDDVWGLLCGNDNADALKGRSPKRLAPVMIIAWIVLSAVVVIFNILWGVEILEKPVQNNSVATTSYTSQDGTPSQVTTNYGSLNFNVEINPNIENRSDQ